MRDADAGERATEQQQQQQQRYPLQKTIGSRSYKSSSAAAAAAAAATATAAAVAETLPCQGAHNNSRKSPRSIFAATFCWWCPCCRAPRAAAAVSTHRKHHTASSSAAAAVGSMLHDHRPCECFEALFVRLLPVLQQHHAALESVDHELQQRAIAAVAAAAAAAAARPNSSISSSSSSSSVSKCLSLCGRHDPADHRASESSQQQQQQQQDTSKTTASIVGISAAAAAAVEQQHRQQQQPQQKQQHRQRAAGAVPFSRGTMTYGYALGVPSAAASRLCEPQRCEGPNQETGEEALGGGGGPCVLLCRWLDSFVTHCLCPPFDVAFKQRLALQRALLLLFCALSCVAAVYPFAFLSLVEAQTPFIRPKLLPVNQTTSIHQPASAASAAAPAVAAAAVPDAAAAAAAADRGHLRKAPLTSARTLSPPAASSPLPPLKPAAKEAAADEAAGVETAAERDTGDRGVSWMSTITFVPSLTQHLYSFDRGLLYALLFWGLLLLLPCQSLLLLVALAVSRAGEDRPPAAARSRSRSSSRRSSSSSRSSSRPRGTRLDCAAWFAAANGRMLAWNGCCSSPVLGVLSAVNLSSYFVAAATHKTQLLVLAWSQLAIALLVHFPLGLHARNVTVLSEAAAALLLLQHALEAEHLNSRPSSSLNAKHSSRQHQQQQQQQRQQQLEVASSAEVGRSSISSSKSSSSLLHALVEVGHSSRDAYDHAETKPLLSSDADSSASAVHNTPSLPYS
ncbi:hypothetical protein ACSSS7_005658 [Eimeria intestinalis]